MSRGRRSWRAREQTWSMDVKVGGSSGAALGAAELLAGAGWGKERGHLPGCEKKGGGW